MPNYGYEFLDKISNFENPNVINIFQSNVSDTKNLDFPYILSEQKSRYQKNLKSLKTNYVKEKFDVGDNQRFLGPVKQVSLVPYNYLYYLLMACLKMKMILISFVYVCVCLFVFNKQYPITIGIKVEYYETVIITKNNY